MGYHREMQGAVRRHAVLGTLYLAQGISYGFAGWILIPTLAAQGVSLADQAGILAAGAVPWVFKAIWGVFMDRIGRRRWGPPRVMAMVGQGLMAVSFAALALLDDPSAHIRWLVYAWFGHNVALTLQDVATDALALDSLAEHERGRANAVMLGSHHVGMEGLAALGLGAVVGAAGLSAGLWVAAAVLAALAPAPLIMAAPGRVPASSVPILIRLRRAFAASGPRRAAVLALVILVADNVTATASAQFLVEHLGWSVEEVQARLPWLVLVAYLVGYAAAALVVDRMGHRNAVVVGCVGMGLTWAGFALAQSAWGDPQTVQVMVFLQVVATALLMAGLHAFLMDRTDPAVRATQFVLFMALLNMSRWIGPTVTPGLFEILEYRGLFLASGLFQLALVPLVLWAGARSVTDASDPRSR